MLGRSCVGHSGGTAYSPLDCRFVSMLFTFHMYIRIKQDRAQPIVTVEMGRGILVQYDSIHSGKQFLIKLADMPMVGNMFIEYRHLPTSDTGADVRHSIIVTDLLMLIIRVRFSRLGSIEHDLLFRLLVRADQCPAAGSGNHLVPVKREYTIPSKRSANLSVVPAAQPFGGIFDNRNSILISNSHDFLNLCRHPVQINKDDCLRLLARLGNPVFYGLFQ